MQEKKKDYERIDREQAGLDQHMARVEKMANIGRLVAGIAHEIMKKIWNPFFTTKEIGKGTGLGLPICHDIVDKLGGTIAAENKPEGGAVFTLKFPLKR